MKVSVIIPCYNGEEFIGQALGSLLDQTRPADEIIVVDDGSTDRSAEIAQSFGASVTVLSKGGGGAPSARNCGADHATGDAIMFLDADDVLAPDVLENLINQLKKNPDGVVACPWYHLMKIGNKWVKQPPTCKPLGKNQDHLSGWLTGWFHLPCTILWSRIAYKNTGGWDTRAYVNNDGDLMMRALAGGVNLQITDKGVSFYRRLPEVQQSESLSGARFTRKGREAQIYVVHKIAQMLEDRGKINEYRKPITQAFEQYRNLCMDHYPDLSERCSDLIVQFGEPRYIQIARKFGKSAHKKAQSVRRILGLAKKRILNKLQGKNAPGLNGNKKNYEEIRYGLDTYHKIRSEGKKGELKKPSNPDVSVILPISINTKAFNRTLKSVLDQEFSNFEVIIIGKKQSETQQSGVDIAKDSRFRFVSSENNGNLAALRNQGLKEVKGDFIAFLDPGDEWYPAKLARQLEYFKKAPDDVGLVYTGSELIDGQGEKTEYLPAVKGDAYSRLLHQNIINCSSTVMIRRTVIASIGFYDSNLPGFENHDYWLRISRFFNFDFIEDALVKCKIREDGESSKRLSRENKSQRLFLDKFHRDLKQIK